MTTTDSVLPVRDSRGRFLPVDPELRAIATIQRNLEPLDEATRHRIIRWLSARFKEGAA